MIRVLIQSAHQTCGILCRDLAFFHHLQNFLAFFRRHYLPPSKAFKSSSACWEVILFSASIFKIAIRSFSETGTEGGIGGVGGLRVPLKTQFQRPTTNPLLPWRTCRSA